MRHVTIHGHSVGYRRCGSGQAVLLIHGLAGSSRTWDAVLPELGSRYDVVAPDMLGHGESAKPVGDYSLGAYASGLRDLLAVLDVSSATLVGHSFGGGVAMQLAYQFPQLVDRLVLVGSGGLGREVSWLLRTLSMPGAEYLMSIGFPTPLVERANDFGRVLARRDIRWPWLGEMWRAYRSLAGASNRQAFVRTMRGVIEPGGQIIDATDRLYLAARVPTMLMWGANDAIIPAEHGQRAHALIEHSRLEILDDVGHFPHVEAPDRFVDLLVDFVETTEPGPGEALWRDVLAAGA
ncbi:MAG: alpha/beta fold hydrolase [Ilumatobacteraceae bacterium]|nr:alpha/beta fold hydrolase [Ilumatobacteraceae bacterium]